MKGRKLDEGSVIRSLGRKRDIRFDFRTGTMEIIDQRKGKNPAQDLGNKSWGMIDFLSGKGWRKEFVREFKNDNSRIQVW